jgi:hypothetical protein
VNYSPIHRLPDFEPTLARWLRIVKSIRCAVILTMTLAAILFCGCASPAPRPVVQVSVNGIAPSQRPAVRTSFVVLPGDKNVPSNDLQFQEYAKDVERALVQRGYKPATSFETADVAVYLVYGVGEPKEHLFSYVLPIYGQTGISSATTYTSAAGNAYKVGNTVYGSGNSSSTTYFEPRYGVAGYSTQIGTSVTYTSHINLEAVDLDVYRTKNKVVQLWKTDIANVGACGDLRRVFPVMVAAAEDYFAVNTTQAMMVSVYEDDPRIQLIKGVAPTSQR